MSAAISRARETPNRAWIRIRGAWSGSLVLRTVGTAVAASIVVVVIVAAALLQRVTSGLLEAKEAASVAEAAAGWDQAQRLLAAADTSGAAGASADRLVDAVVTDLARNAGSPPRYELILTSAPGSTTGGPQRATNLVSTDSVPGRLSVAVSADGVQSWTNTSVVYLSGESSPGLAVGAPLQVPGVGPYHLIYLFPYDAEEGVIGLVRSATLIAGTLLVFLLAIVVWFVVRQVAIPVRAASRAAGRIAGGDFDQRIPVKGEDEMAQLASSFNTMAGSLQRQIEALEDLSRVQRRFVSDVSHELRTPLTTVRMATDVLHDGRHQVDPDTQRAAELLAIQVDRFEALLADLLEISRIDAGAAELEVSSQNVTEVVARLLDENRGLAEEYGCTLRFRGEPDPILADMDVRRVDRILRNLLHNALEYGAGAPISVETAATEGVVAIAVRDQGTGLSDQDQQKVFDRFWRADPSRARTLGGTGLGLSIASEDAILHGGALQVASVPGEGALFVLTLPRAAGGELSGVRPIPVLWSGRPAQRASQAGALVPESDGPSLTSAPDHQPRPEPATSGPGEPHNV